MTSPDDEGFNCYATLGVTPYAEEADIQEAYDQKVKLYNELDDDSPEGTALAQNVWHGSNSPWQCIQAGTLLTNRVI